MRAIILFLLLLVPATATADWSRTPTYIDDTADCANVHYTQGGGKLVRINNTTIALVCNGSSENIRRSTDNGAKWTMIDNEGGNSGCLISGPNNYVYHFSRYSSAIRMVKFLYNAETIPAPSVITSIGNTVFGAYQLVNATIDADGNLYVFYHHDDENIGSDGLFVIKSEDAGATWRTPVKIADGSDGIFGMPDSEVRENGDIVVTFSEWGGDAVWFGISTDEGTNWSIRQIADGIVSNPTILTKGSDIYIFGQEGGIYDGLVFTKSTDSGSTWSNWASIQSNSTIGYADPFPALGSDDTIYVAFRGAQEPTSFSDDLRQYIAMSTDDGASWTFPFHQSLTSDGRVGTKSHIRYQTFWNYGGPLEWTWLEERAAGSDDYPTMYNINTDVTIKSHENENINYTVSVSKSGNGSGTVTSSPSGISCGSDCTGNYLSGISVSLLASANAGSTASWSDCAAAGGTVTGNGSKLATCSFSSLDADKTVMTAFSLIISCFQDLDQDTYGSNIIIDDDGDGVCETADGESIVSTDCDDTNTAIHPNATGVCDGVDNNCDGNIDQGVTLTWHLDSDRDGYGDAGSSIEACAQPPGYVSDNRDCNDSDALEHPNQTWYKDDDGDGFSDGSMIISCQRPENYYVASELARTSGDPDDTDPDIIASEFPWPIFLPAIKGLGNVF